MTVLTTALLNKQKAPSKGRLEIHDKETPGFGCRRSAKETTFFFYSRVMEKGEVKKQRYHLGEWGEEGQSGKITLAKAREKAEEIRRKIQAGIDPRSEEEAAAKAEAVRRQKTFAHMAELFLKVYVRKETTGGKAKAIRTSKPLRAATERGYKWALQGDPTKTWIALPVSDISRSHVRKIINKFEDEGHDAAARLWKAYISKFFSWCLDRDLIDFNPAANMAVDYSAAENARVRVLTLDELSEVIAAASAMPDPFRSFVHVLALCGQRRQETSFMRWDGLDLNGESPVWQIPAEVTKNRRPHDVPLAPEVVGVLNSLPRLSHDGKDCPYVFSTDGKNPISGFSKFKASLDKHISATRKEQGPIPHWTLHDLRRTVATHLNDMGTLPHVVEAILNHISGSKAGVAGTYNRATYDDERRKALAAWARQVLRPAAANFADSGENGGEA
ncbi:tyrosine-type recombinase/integrase [Aestuariivirga sp.]|uniref:tyrosine-type recombinase/integrase n=1 Tax=Aestuariivirga sp. TaxID=2650926 RepID=UPI0035946DC4